MISSIEALRKNALSSLPGRAFSNFKPLRKPPQSRIHNDPNLGERSQSLFVSSIYSLSIAAFLHHFNLFSHCMQVYQEPYQKLIVLNIYHSSSYRIYLSTAHEEPSLLPAQTTPSGNTTTAMSGPQAPHPMILEAVQHLDPYMSNKEAFGAPPDALLRELNTYADAYDIATIQYIQTHLRADRNQDAVRYYLCATLLKHTSYVHEYTKTCCGNTINADLIRVFLKTASRLHSHLCLLRWGTYPTQQEQEDIVIDDKSLTTMFFDLCPAFFDMCLDTNQCIINGLASLENDFDAISRIRDPLLHMRKRKDMLELKWCCLQGMAYSSVLSKDSEREERHGRLERTRGHLLGHMEAWDKMFMQKWERTQHAMIDVDEGIWREMELERPSLRALSGSERNVMASPGNNVTRSSRLLGRENRV